ncbi:MAG: TVP38/TMEM64 family protein [Spirochaetales bacterium]|nr:TVP38/TMEM64 family protein [Spirochaetales bacterium]
MGSSGYKKIGLIAGGGVLVALFFIADMQQYLTLDYLKGSQETFADLYAGQPLLVMGGYVLSYILVTGLSLPGAVVMTLAGGGLFGLWKGLLLVSFASTIGATCACFAARFILRDWVQHKFGDKLTTINAGVEKEGAFYLFSLRLIPVFPFFMINLLMGLTKMRLTTFFWVSQLGMLPGTLVFVNAGKEIAKIDSLSGILSPSLLGSFVALGLFPLAVKKIMAFVRTNKPQE